MLRRKGDALEPLLANGRRYGNLDVSVDSVSMCELFLQVCMLDSYLCQLFLVSLNDLSSCISYFLLSYILVLLAFKPRLSIHEATTLSAPCRGLSPFDTQFHHCDLPLDDSCRRRRCGDGFGQAALQRGPSRLPDCCGMHRIRISYNKAHKARDAIPGL